MGSPVKNLVRKTLGTVTVSRQLHVQFTEDGGIGTNGLTVLYQRKGALGRNCVKEVVTIQNLSMMEKTAREEQLRKKVAQCRKSVLSTVSV